MTIRRHVVVVAAVDAASRFLYDRASHSTEDGDIAKLRASDGTLDTTFNPHTTANGFNGAVWTLALAPSPSPAILVGGEFSTAQSGGNKIANHIARVDATTGIADTTFSPQSGGNGFDNSVDALVVQGGDVYVGGSFTQYRGVAGSAARLVKLNATTGVLDTAFNGATGTNGFVGALASSGTALYIGGTFSTYGGASALCVAKVDLASGNPDTTFSPPGMNGFDDRDCQVYSLAAGPSAVRVGGFFTAYRGSTAINYVQLDPSSGAPK